MAELGTALTAGNSALLSGPLGNVFVGYKGYMLGKTTEDTALMSEDDIKDILYSQDGTKPSDHVTTGTLKVVNAVFGEIKTSLLALLIPGFSSLATPGSGDDSGTGGRFIYTSHRDTRAGVLRLYATDSDGQAVLDDESVINCYEAVALVDETEIQWGADTQRNLSVRFVIYYHVFGDDQVEGGPSGAFYYFGDPSQEKVPAAAWPDISAPLLVTAEADSATNIALTFNENIAVQAGAAAGMIAAKVDDVYILATTIGTPSGATVDITFPGASFASGDVIEISIGALAFEDTEATPNAFPGVDGAAVTNSVP